MQQMPGAMEAERPEAPKGAAALGTELGFWAAARRRLAPDDPFFAAGDLERELLAKHVALDLSEVDRYQIEKMEVASTWLLSIHVSEAHDSYFQAKVARGFAMYECLVEGCGVKLKSYKSRQQHLIDKHQFPKSFEFFKKARTSQRQRQKNHRRQTAPKGEEQRDTLMDVEGKGTRHTNWRYRPKQHDHKESKENEHQQKEAKENEMEVEQKIDELTSAVSKLSTVDSTTPATVTFGHRRSRGLTFVPRSIRQNKQASQPEGK
ncbi:hypothetical protein PR202_gb12967 [Eleusine coracana subsp. coracana]|uniref:C2H2-type domain-containing protein n=1 Tax=Eleusine coracana subsp. coracana TaxID=191504 RepID=A0AAV5EQZ7_ELECO|nr:hypothetical protein PR202_gb12967 [Eleusine coracana subsp. coracana]